MKSIPNGIYPVMITPFTEDNRVDYAAMEGLLNYYAANGCSGVFGLCQSSEIFWLSNAEMKEMITFLVRHKDPSLALVASAHTATDVEEGIRQLAMMMEGGADQPVIILNRLALPHEGEDVVKRNAERIFKALPGVTFGIYECPYPYHRLASVELLRWFAQSGRIGFLKDTCGNTSVIAQRLEAARGTGLQLFNANAATLLQTLRLGASGFSGVMANFHADLYAALLRFHADNDPRADRLQAFLTLASAVETQLYPVNCKYHLRHIGIPATLVTRTRDMSGWTATLASQTDDLFLMEEEMRRIFGLK